MEPNANPTSSVKWYQIAMLVIGIALLASGGYKLYTAFQKPGKVSAAFIAKFNEISNLSQDIAKTSALENLDEMTKKEDTKDWAGALQIANAALVKNAQTTDKMNNLVAKAAEFKDMASQIADPAAKASTLKVVDLLEKNDRTNLDFLAVQKKIFEMIVKYYQDRQSGKNVTVPANLNDLIKQAQTLSQEAQTIGTQYNAAVDEMAKNSGISYKKNQ